jgi:hypothetical protein
MPFLCQHGCPGLAILTLVQEKECSACGGTVMEWGNSMLDIQRLQSVQVSQTITHVLLRALRH